MDAERLLHANGHHAAVVIEPLAAAIARQRDDDQGEPTFRRLG